MTRLFTAKNTNGATVHDVEGGRRIDQVMSIDVDAGVVTVADQPVRLVGDEIATHVERYRSIYPIYGGRRSPQAFHCYGQHA